MNCKAALIYCVGGMIGTSYNIKTNVGMNKRFISIILQCQNLRAKHGFEYEEKCKKHIDKFSKEIIENDLINKCGNEKDFAEQLCIANELNYKK